MLAGGREEKRREETNSWHWTHDNCNWKSSGTAGEGEGEGAGQQKTYQDDGPSLANRVAGKRLGVISDRLG